MFYLRRPSSQLSFALTSHEEEEVQVMVPDMCADARVATAEYPLQHVSDIRVLMPSLRQMSCVTVVDCSGAGVAALPRGNIHRICL